MPPTSDTVAAIVLASIIAIILTVVLVLVLVPSSNCCRPLASSGASADKTVLLLTPGLSYATTVTVNGTTLFGESGFTLVAPGSLSYKIVAPAHMEATGNITLPNVSSRRHMVPAETSLGTMDAVAYDIWTLVNSGSSHKFVKQHRVGGNARGAFLDALTEAENEVGFWGSSRN